MKQRNYALDTGFWKDKMLLGFVRQEDGVYMDFIYTDPTKVGKHAVYLDNASKDYQQDIIDACTKRTMASLERWPQKVIDDLKNTFINKWQTI